MNIMIENKNKEKINKSEENNTDQNEDKKIDSEPIKKRGYNPSRLVNSIFEEDNEGKK
jgi:hypothetical protein